MAPVKNRQGSSRATCGSGRSGSCSSTQLYHGLAGLVVTLVAGALVLNC